MSVNDILYFLQMTAHSEVLLIRGTELISRKYILPDSVTR